MRLIAVVFAFWIAGCGAREEIIVSQLDITHRGWDTLVVSVDFASKTTLGKLKPAQEYIKNIVAYNASYDTLYAGSDSVFAIADADLGNNEKVLVEVCGDIKMLRVCEQRTTLASPKRVTLEPEIRYPLRKKVFEGAYKLPFLIERLEGETWEKINPSTPMHGHLNAYVAGKEDESVQVSFSKSRGEFNLARRSNYKDFKFYLDSALLDEKEAQVIFDVYVDMEGIAESVGRIEKDIKLKTEEEQMQEVAAFVEQASSVIVDQLSPYLRRKENTVYIDRWSYNTFKKMYSVDIEIEWKGRMFNRSTYQMEGILEVYDEGERASFRYRDGNRRARQRWESHVNGPVMELMGGLSGEAPVKIAENQPGRQAMDGRPFRAESGMLVIDAEHFKNSRSYKDQAWVAVKSKSSYAGDGAVVIQPEKGKRIRSRYNKRSPELTYSAYFPEGGKYFLWLRVWADDKNGNSLHLGIDGEAIRSASYMGTENYGRWVWTQHQFDTSDPATIHIARPGVKEINLWMREDGIYVDKIVLTKDRRYRPEGQGPAESIR